MIIYRRKLLLPAAAIIVAAGFFLFWENISPSESEMDKDNLGVNYATSSSGLNNEKEVVGENINKEIVEDDLVEEVDAGDILTKNQEEMDEEKENISKEPLEINIPVPFTTQSPLVKWDDPRQQDGCEEAVSVMAMAWVNNEGLKTKITPAEFEKRILALSDFQEEKYGEFRDTSLYDIETRIFEDYFSYEKIELKAVATTSDIISELEAGKIVLLPMAGRELKNPNFKAPGPLTHMILIKGYDYQAKEFITNDPGTRLGADYRYPAERIYSAIWVYPTGYHQETNIRERAMLVVSKS